MKLGYARVSTGEQNLDNQCRRLLAEGCEMLFEEKMSGAAKSRPSLEKLIEQLRKDDVLVITRLDRLARSTNELLRIVEQITKNRPDYNHLTNHGQIRQRLPAKWS